jgi:hypothetical protein
MDLSTHLKFPETLHCIRNMSRSLNFHYDSRWDSDGFGEPVDEVLLVVIDVFEELWVGHGVEAWDMVVLLYFF